MEGEKGEDDQEKCGDSSITVTTDVSDGPLLAGNQNVAGEGGERTQKRERFMRLRLF